MKFIPVIIRRSLLWIHVLLIIALILSAYLRYVDPANWWVAGFAGLAFPFLWLLNLPFIIIWWLYRRKYWLLSGAGILITIPAVCLTYGFHFFGSGKTNTSKSFTIMSFNCSSMGMGGEEDIREIREGIYEKLEETRPDILCLQEFYYNDHPEKFINNLDSLRRRLHYPYYYFVKHDTWWYTWHFGTILFSQFPIIDTASADLDDHRKAEKMITASVLVRGDTVRILSTHLASYHLQPHDYQTVDAKDAANARGLLGKMRRSFSLRAQQARLMRQEIDKSKYPVIVVGDFNDIPLSYTYNTIRGDNLQDAFLQQGSGFGRTFASLSRTLRIDYILPDKRFTVEAFTVHRRKRFEHFPIMARLSLRH